MSPKRERDDSPAPRSAPPLSAKPTGPRAPRDAPSSSPYMPMFEEFRAELDEHQDRRERVIKTSRDLTALSKKMIFSLQRTPALCQPLPTGIRTETATRASAIAALIRPLLPIDLAGLNTHRYARQISPGLQELVEAASFQRYLETGALLSLNEARQELADMVRRASEEDGKKQSETGQESVLGNDDALAEAAGQLLGEEDWLLGVFDAVGELMRWVITAMATGGAIPGAPTEPDTTMDVDGDPPGPETASRSLGSGRNMVVDLRQLRAALEALDMRGASVDREAGKKMEVMRACVDKVEAACYGLIVRGRERLKGWVPDVREQGPKAEAVEGH